MHLQADPTKLELLHKSFKVKKEDFKEKQRDGILEKVQSPNLLLKAAAYLFSQPIVAQYTGGLSIHSG